MGVPSETSWCNNFCNWWHLLEPFWLFNWLQAGAKKNAARGCSSCLLAINNHVGGQLHCADQCTELCSSDRGTENLAPRLCRERGEFPSCLQRFLLPLLSWPKLLQELITPRCLESHVCARDEWQAVCSCCTTSSQLRRWTGQQKPPSRFWKSTAFHCFTFEFLRFEIADFSFALLKPHSLHNYVEYKF